MEFSDREGTIADSKDAPAASRRHHRRSAAMYHRCGGPLSFNGGGVGSDMDTQHPSYGLRLLGGFALLAGGQSLVVAPGSQRVLSFLALQERPVARGWVASCLWPETADERAAANLRSALWRLHECGHDIVTGTAHLAVREEVSVDVRDLSAAARRLRVSGDLPAIELVERSRGELLPGCWEPWLDFDRERLRLERIHVCTAYAEGALAGGQPHLAASAALSALECDPLCESSNALLIRAQLALGRPLHAVQAFERYAALLLAEVGVEPSDWLRQLVAGVGRRVALPSNNVSMSSSPDVSMSSSPDVSMSSSPDVSMSSSPDDHLDRVVVAPVEVVADFEDASGGVVADMAYA
jgi:DNA-binding SARP family transcriptional activator